METLMKYLAERRALILTGHITETRVYESYLRYALARDGCALSFEAARPYIRGEIWQIRVWWAGNMGFMAEQALHTLFGGEA